MIEQEQETTSQGRTLIVNQQTHKALSWLKLEGDYKSIDEVVNMLLEAYGKLKVFELNQKNQIREENKQTEKKANGTKKQK